MIDWVALAPRPTEDTNDVASRSSEFSSLGLSLFCFHIGEYIRVMIEIPEGLKGYQNTDPHTHFGIA